MIMEETWGTDMEIFTFASLCQTNVYVYGSLYGKWSVHPQSLSVNNFDVLIKSVYLLHSKDHYDVISSVIKTWDGAVIVHLCHIMKHVFHTFLNH